MAGVGKTQLAVHAGHLLARAMPFDRVLFVNLRGFHPDPTQPPADPAAVLDGFLRLLGVPGQQIPHNVDARTAAYRDRLAGTRTLVVLDNATDAEQVRPLLPETPGCLTLVTSRRSLTDLPSAANLKVDVFTPEEALDFLTRAVPDVADGADPHAAARIAQRCGYLPLALGLVAGHVRGTPGWTLTDHADRLDERHHHRHLESGVQLALDLSYQHLPGDRQRLLRLAALHPGQDFDAYAAAALVDIDLGTAEERLHHLCREHLLQQATAGRYSFHDLVRAYAADRAIDQDPPPQRHAALTRLLDLYVATSAAAMVVAYPHERQHRPTVPPASTPMPDLADRNQADRWLDAELANLLAAAGHAVAHGWPEHIWQLSAILDRHLRTCGRHQDAQTLQQHVLDLARRLGNHSAEVVALNSLGLISWRLGRFEQADDLFGRALQIAQAIGDGSGELGAINGLGHVHWMLGRYEQAGEHYGQALLIAQTTGDREGELQALTGLGHVHRTLGRHGEAAGCYRQVIDLARELRSSNWQFEGMQGMGRLHHATGHPDLALTHHEQALRYATDLAQPEDQACAHDGLAHAHYLLNQHDQARLHWQHALDILTSLGTDRTAEPEASVPSIRAHLADLSRHSPTELT